MADVAEMIVAADERFRQSFADQNFGHVAPVGFQRAAGSWRHEQATRSKSSRPLATVSSRRPLRQGGALTCRYGHTNSRQDARLMSRARIRKRRDLRIKFLLFEGLRGPVAR
jgi:hypothetical protein